MSNILPYEQKKLVQKIRVLRLATATIWALVLLVVAAILLLIPMLVMVNTHHAIAESQIAQLERAGALASPVDIATLESRVATLTAKLATPPAPAPTVYINIVRAVLTSGITLSGYSMEDSDTPSLDVAGTASSREALQRFVAALERTEGIASVDSPVSNYVQSTNSPFQIEVTFTQP